MRSDQRILKNILSPRKETQSLFSLLLSFHRERTSSLSFLVSRVSIIHSIELMFNATYTASVCANIYIFTFLCIYRYSFLYMRVYECTCSIWLVLLCINVYSKLFCYFLYTDLKYISYRRELIGDILHKCHTI